MEPTPSHTTPPYLKFHQHLLSAPKQLAQLGQSPDPDHSLEELAFPMSLERSPRTQQAFFAPKPHGSGIAKHQRSKWAGEVLKVKLGFAYAT